MGKAAEQHFPGTGLLPFLARTAFRVFKGLPVIACVFLFIQPVEVFGQTLNEMRGLFFDGVYLDDSDKVLLTSSGRPSLADSTPLTNFMDKDTSAADMLASIRSYEDSIESLIEANGLYDPRLAQEYLSAGNLYIEAGDFENAIEAYENTMHIHRVNQGLFTLSQAEAVRKLIDSNKTMRNFSDADKYHEYLYYLISQNYSPEDDELVSATLEWADWNMEAYRRLTFLQEDDLSVPNQVSSAGASLLRKGELVAIEDDQFNEILFVPRTALIAGGASIRALAYTPDQLIDPRLKRADELYDVILEGDEHNEEALLKKANIAYLFKTQLEDFISDNYIGSNITAPRSRAVRSVSVLRRSYSESRNDLLALAEARDDPKDKARAYLSLGDWDLIYDRQQRAVDDYNLARETLLAAGMSEEEITTFITPEPALFVPQYVTYRDTRHFQNIPELQEAPYLGYIDVSFSKNRSGNLRNIEILDASANTGFRIRNRLLDLLRFVKVRPLFVAGDTEEQSDIKVRYYYSY